MIQGRPGDAADLGNGVLGDSEPEEMTDLILLVAEVRDTQRPFGPAGLLAGQPGLGQALANSFGVQVEFDFGKQREERRHDLGLDVLLGLDMDLFLDGDESDAFPGQRVKHGDDLAEQTAEPGELADNQATSEFESAHQVIEPAALGRRHGRGGRFDKNVNPEADDTLQCIPIRIWLVA